MTCSRAGVARRWPLAALALIALCGSASAAPPRFGCYTQTYSPERLAQNPGQTVRSIAIALRRFRGDPGDRVDVVIDVSVRFADRPGVWRTRGGCTAEAGGLKCGFDGDAGMALVRADGGGLRLEIPTALAIEGDEGRVVIEGPAHRSFVLIKSGKQKACL